MHAERLACEPKLADSRPNILACNSHRRLLYHSAWHLGYKSQARKWMDTGPILITGASGYLGRTLISVAPAAPTLHLVQHHAPLSAVPTGSATHQVDLADG